MPTKYKRQYTLDLLRIVAACSIVLFHYSFRGIAADNMCILGFPSIATFFKYGYMGFYLFFILSGYLISFSIEKKLLFEFIVSRIARLYPAFWVSVIITSLATVYLGDGRYSVSLPKFLANLTMLNKLFGIKPVDGAYWYLYVLLKLYLLMAMFIIFRKFIGIRTFAVVIFVLDVLVYHNSIPKLGIVLEPEYSPFFIAGITFYLMKKDDGEKKLVNSLFLLICFAFCLEIVIDKSFQMRAHYQTAFSPLVTGFVLFMVFTIFLFSTIIQFNLENKWLMKFGLATYPLYLLHENIGFMIFNKYGRNSNKYVLLLIVLLLIWSLAFIISTYIEPFLYEKLKKCLYYPKHCVAVCRAVNGDIH